MIQSGPYRLSRNPQIVGFSLSRIGFTIIWPSWHVVISSITYMIFAHIKVMTKEEHFMHGFGDVCRTYCERGPGYIGKTKGNPRKRKSYE